MVLAALALCGCFSGVASSTCAGSTSPTAYETGPKVLPALWSPTAVRPFLTANRPIEISELKISVAPQPGDWATCARTSEGRPVSYYHRCFFRDRAVFDTRTPAS